MRVVSAKPHNVHCIARVHYSPLSPLSHSILVCGLLLTLCSTMFLSLVWVWRTLLKLPTITPIGSRYSSTTAVTVTVSQEKALTLIGINRPEKRNCVDPNTARQLITAFEEFESNESSLVAVLHGKGGYFCSGLDLSSVSQLGKDEAPLDKFFFDPAGGRGVGPMGPSRRPFFSKPVIAAIDGYAVAGGLELALACDLRVMEESAIVGIFCRRFGVPLIDGGTVRLQALIGLSRAMDLILTGRPVGGKEAYEIGLANRLVGKGEALKEAIALGHSIVQFPQECLRADRESAYYAAYSASSFSDATRNELEQGLGVILKESVQGASRFVGGTGRHGSFEK